MSRVLENDAKSLLSRFGITVPASLVIERLDAVDACEAGLGYPMIVKVLVPSGRKAKAGGVRIAKNREELRDAIASLLGATVHGYVAERLLVERFVEVEREVFLSISYDAIHRGPQLLFGARGGVDVEESRSVNGCFTRVSVSPLVALADNAIRDGWHTIGFEGADLLPLTTVTRAAWNLWSECDASFLEINPLGMLANGEICALGALLRLDDDALYRHSELTGFTDPGNDRSWKALSARERAVLAADARDPYRGTIRYTDMLDGDIGVCGVGGGGSLVTFDLLVHYGLRPANYAELGGNPSAAKVQALVSTILSQSGLRALLINSVITNNTRTDEVARGIVGGLRDHHIDPARFPTVIRLAGLHDREGRRLLADAGFACFGEDVTMEDVVARLAQLLRHESGVGVRM
jgi:succinyl-CoA synthetase beta subunit